MNKPIEVYEALSTKKGLTLFFFFFKVPLGSLKGMPLNTPELCQNRRSSRVPRNNKRWTLIIRYLINTWNMIVALQIYIPERKFFTCMKKKSKRKQVFSITFSWKSQWIWEDKQKHEKEYMLMCALFLRVFCFVLF